MTTARDAGTVRKSAASSLSDAQDAVLARQLSDGCDALGLALDDSTTATLLSYVSLIAHWNRVHNLTAVRDRAGMVTQHLLDCLAVVRPLSDQFGGPPASLADVGSGAGLPGLVLAIVWPQSAVYLVEPAGKRAAFLRQCCGQLRLRNVTVVQQRVQSLTNASFRPHDDPGPALIVSRAYAALAEFVLHAAPLAGSRTIIAAMKSARAGDEIAQWTSQLAAQPAENRGRLPQDAYRYTQSIALAVPGMDAERTLVVLEPAPTGN